MRNIRDLILGLFGTAVGIAVMILFLFSVPLSVIAVMRLTGWDWWGALVAVVLGGVVPFLGQIGYVVATVLGAYYLIDADFSWRRAVAPKIETFSMQELTPEQLMKYQNDAISVEIERQCKEDARSRFGFEGKLPQRMSEFCGCYAHSAASLWTNEEAAYQEEHGGPSSGFMQTMALASQTCQQ